MTVDTFGKPYLSESIMAVDPPATAGGTDPHPQCKSQFSAWFHNVSLTQPPEALKTARRRSLFALSRLFPTSPV